VAAELLADWDEALGQFVRVMPKDYEKVLAQQSQQEQPEPERSAQAPREPVGA
jgi:glutamate synthase (NADPH/NADH) large chain